MSNAAKPDEPRSLAWDIDPRRSLAAAAMWLIIGLAITFSIAAALWVGSIARANVIEQHVRRLSLETEQLSSDLGQALASRLGAIRAARTLAPNALKDVFNELVSAYPDLDWIAIADADGVIVSTRDSLPAGTKIASRRWFAAGLQGPWLGVIDEHPRSPGPVLGDMAAPVRDQAGRVVGVIAAHLSWQRAPNHPLRLTDEVDPHVATQAYVLDRDGAVLVGPADSRGTHWQGIGPGGPPAALQFERLPNGRQVLASRAPLSAGGGVSALGWQALLCEPIERVYQRADALALKILWVSLCLGAATAFLGIIGARQLTRRLKRLTQSVASLGQSPTARLAVPPGLDEVAQLGRAFATIHDDLQRQRSELQTLSGELERRVTVRTLEVQRLAEESRYAAIVRERLKIARDLHDTLAHSMMAMLSEVRFLRRLQTHDPGAVPAELAHAEEVAHEGLKEARAAITQMRVTAVRDMGLGPALANAFERFIDHTGLGGEFTAQPAAARFGDERAETILKMANEALRNVERHARATRVMVSLKSVDDTHLELCVEDNGVGFEPRAVRPGHYGIVGLREQAELIGAQLRIDSRPDAGTHVCVLWRLSPIEFTGSARGDAQGASNSSSVLK
jgi:signal transduction histidine kinase